LLEEDLRMTEFTRVVESAGEYREIVKHAEALGFELTECDAYGMWETEYVKTESSWASVDSEPCWPSIVEIKDTGQKYFTMEMDDTVCKVVPAKSSASGDGKLELMFRG